MLTMRALRRPAQRSCLAGQERWRDGSHPTQPPSGSVARIVRLTTAAVAVSALATVLVWTLPFARFAYRGPAMHTALETAAAMVALLVAYLVYLRFRRRGRVSDLLLFAALGMLAATNALFSALPAALGQAPATFSTWAPVGGRLLAAVLLAAAAFAPDAPLRRPRRALVTVVAATGATLGLIALAVALLGRELPMAVQPDLSPDASGGPLIAGHPTVLAVQVLAMLLFGAAAVGFVRSARTTNDELIAWFALASVLGAFARLNYFLFPSLYSNWVYTGDGLRLAFHVALLLGALREIRAYQRGLVEAGALRERRRVARDLHDGLAQELAFVVTATRRLAAGDDTNPSAVQELRTAAERALDLSRDAIAALVRPIGDAVPLDLLVAQAARDVADRAGVDVEVTADPGVDGSPEARSALVPIVREAVTNAARHGGARTVTIELTRRDGLRVRILDDGAGFDPAKQDGDAGGFGLNSMRERAAAGGGDLDVVSLEGRGTLIEVVLP